MFTRLCRPHAALVVRLLGWTTCAAASSFAPAAAWPPDSVRSAYEIGRAKSNEGLAIEPVASRIRATAGRPVAVYFRSARPAPLHRTAPVHIDDPRIVRLVEDAQLPADAALGCALVEGLAPGQTVLTIGGAAVEVEVIATRAGRVGIGDQPDRLFTPMDDAAAWGEVTIGASWWRGDSPVGSSKRHILFDGYADRASVAPDWVSPESDGPLALAAFRIDLSAFPPGPLVLRLVDPVASTSHESGPTIRLRVFHPQSEGNGPSTLLTGECEAAYPLPELPPERREPKPTIRKHESASGGEYFDNAGATPRFRFPIEVPSDAGAGWYQVVATAAGDRACGVWPAVGVTIDEAQYPLTRSSIAMGEFHRVPIGTPIRLDIGQHVLRLDFLNDFYVGGAADRNLRLDRIEVLRVADAGPAGADRADAPGMMAMMSAATDSGAGARMSMQPDAMMAASGTGSVGRARWPESASRIVRARPTTLAFARPIDGAVVAGDLEIRGVVTWPDMNQRDSRGATPRPPVTRLIVNGRPAGDQVAAAPRFVVPWDLLSPPPHQNTILLAAEDPNGAPGQAATAVAHVRRSEDRRSGEVASTTDGASADRRPRFARFTVHDPRWTDASRQRLTADQAGAERSCFGLFGPGDVALLLPDELEGDYEIDLEARGQHFRGAPELAVTLENDAQLPPNVLGVLPVPGSWDAHPLMRGLPSDKRTPAPRGRAIARLATGPKVLRLTFENDLYEPEKGDRNVFVQAVVLRAALPTREDPPGGATLIYPAQGQRLAAGIDAADAVIIEPEGTVALHSAEVLIDGVPPGGAGAGLPINLRGRPGPYLIPLSLRGITEGVHTLEVRTTDARGRAVTSAAREIVVARGTEPGTYEQALALLNRVAFGPDERELIAVLTAGPDAYLEQRLADGADSPRVLPAIIAAAARYPNSSSGADVQRRAILEAMTTANPVRARFVLWAENHFSTWIRKAEARRKADEHDRFTRLGVAPFPDLLLASATSPAMLRYLDQEQSFARRLNENYAREIMELHTLGVHGGYTQQDVTSLARLLTGWTTAREVYLASAVPPASSEEVAIDGVGPDEYGMRESFRFDPALGDPQRRTFLGRAMEPARPEERHRRVLGTIAMLASHPSTARFIANKLAAHYASVPPDEALVTDLASTFERTGGDMAEMLRVLVRHPAFRATAGAPTRLAHPPDFALRLARAVGSGDAQAVHDYLNLSGRGMFDRSTPDGYQEDDAEAMDSNAVLQRWRFAKRLESALLDLLPPSARAGDKPIDDAEARALIDLVGMRISGRPPGETTALAAVDLLRSTADGAGGGGGGGRRDDRLRTLVVFLASSPEAQLK